MSGDTLPPLLTLLKAFPGMPVDEARKLTWKGIVKSYPAETVLCTEDHYESTFYIILNGRVRVTKRISASGDEIRLLKNLSSGDFFGEMALIQDAPRAATVTTDQPTSVLEIYKEDFDELLVSSPSLSRALMQEVINRLRANDAMAIDDLRLKAGELAVAYQLLAEQDYARREFFSKIAQAIRSPLETLNENLQTIKHSLAPGELPDAVQLQNDLISASECMEQVIALVNDILFVQEMDPIRQRFEPVDLRMIIENVVAGSRELQAENQVEVKVYGPDVPLIIPGNAAGLHRALSAILENAIKFSYPGGMVKLILEKDNTIIRLRVCDTGVGISADALPHTFDRVFHVGGIDSRRLHGIGLGMPIARQIIEQHRGNIQVISRLGEGTEVQVMLIHRKEA